MNQPALFDVASAFPAHIAVMDSAGSYTYQQLVEHAGRVSAELLGLEGDLDERRVAFLIMPGFDYVAAQWGIWRAGGVAVPLGTKHPPPELAYVIDDADVSIVIVQPELLDRVANIAAYRSIRLITTDQFTSISPRSALPRLDFSRRAMILYTSGSTGRPKGVVTTHGNIQSQIDALVEAWQWQSSDHILHVLPLHHIHGIINVLCCAMRVGAVCEFQPFEAEQVWQRFAEGDLTLFMAVPTVYAKLISAWESATPDRQGEWARGARQMRLMVSGSAALPVSTLETWERITGQRLLERYGMTEIGMALANPLHGNRRAGHVGGPLPGVDVRRTDDEGELVAGATPGEIEVRGPHVFLEYWKQPDATRDSFRDGWFRTGDVALVDAGDYRILGRISVDMIKTGGYKVSALEIEDVLRNHPQIRDCAVVGVPDEEWGERVAVCVVCRDHDGVELDLLRAWAKTQLAAYKVPTLLCTVDELPRNAMGKVQKPAVRELFESG